MYAKLEVYVPFVSLRFYFNVIKKIANFFFNKKIDK